MAKRESERILGPVLKVVRAKHHIADLELRIRGYKILNPYRVVTEDDLQSGYKIYKVAVEHPFSIDYSCILGDAVHNLRSALDYLAWQLVEVSGGIPRKQTGFPIYKSAAEYETQSAAKIKGMSPAAIDAINAVEPYGGGNDDLWALHQLDIIDKHQLLMTCGVGQMRLFLDSALWGQAVELPAATANQDVRVLEDGAELARVKTSPAIQNMNDQVNLSIEVAFGEPEIVRGKPILPFLHQLSDLVNSIVLTFEPFFV